MSKGVKDATNVILGAFGEVRNLTFLSKVAVVILYEHFEWKSVFKNNGLDIWYDV